MYVELKTKEQTKPLWPGIKYLSWVCCYFLLLLRGMGFSRGLCSRFLLSTNPCSKSKFQFNPERETENQPVDALSPLFFFLFFTYLFIYLFIRSLPYSFIYLP